MIHEESTWDFHDNGRMGLADFKGPQAKEQNFGSNNHAPKVRISGLVCGSSQSISSLCAELQCSSNLFSSRPPQ